MKIQLNAAARLTAATASIPITQVGAFFPKQIATLTNLKEGQTVTFRVGKDMHTVTRKGNMLNMSKESVSRKP